MSEATIPTPAAGAPAGTILRNHLGGSWADVDAVETLVDRDPAGGEAPGRSASFYPRKKVVTSRW